MENKVEIFEEDNSIVIDTDFDTTDITFFPEEKKIHIVQSFNRDCFYNNQTLEYRISTEPLELYMRTIERSHEPPLICLIKDGVVLKSDFIKRKKEELGGNYDEKEIQVSINKLEKEIEWEKINIFNNCEVNLYILSKHPEIISKEEYRRFLRQSIEKIKMGVLKIEEIVKEDPNNLKITIDQYGKSIWYPDSDSQKREVDEYLKLSEEKQSKSNYGKKIEYMDKLMEYLFNEDSSKYVGISQEEFRSSDGLVEYIENLLKKKEVFIAEKKEEYQVSNTIFKNMKWVIVIVISIIALSGGVWTAIGVFVLGVIIISILKK